MPHEVTGKRVIRLKKVGRGCRHFDDICKYFVAITARFVVWAGTQGRVRTVIGPVQQEYTVMKHPMMIPLGMVAAVLVVAQPVHAQTDATSVFKRIDTNHDGYITPEEWAAAKQKPDYFVAIDADHDGRITLPELQSAMNRPPSPAPGTPPDTTPEGAAPPTAPNP
jgi:hypothetical protein